MSDRDGSDNLRDELTLTTAQVREMAGRAPVVGLRDWRIEFDRWLAARDASVERRVADAWDEGAALVAEQDRIENPYRALASGQETSE